MATAGPNSPGTVVSSAWAGGSAAWSNPSNVSASDNTYAVASAVTDENPSESLVCSGFGFEVPTGATIDGIVVSVEGKAVGGDTTDFNLAGLLLIGGTEGFDYYRLTPEWVSDAAESTITLGGAADDWDATLTPEIVNNPLFAVSVGLLTSVGECVFSIDHVAMTVHYTAAPSSDIATINGVARASIATVNGLALASVGSVNGVA